MLAASERGSAMVVVCCCPRRAGGEVDDASHFYSDDPTLLFYPLREGATVFWAALLHEAADAAMCQCRGCSGFAAVLAWRMRPRFVRSSGPQKWVR
jgi:hypothetical protein